MHIIIIPHCICANIYDIYMNATTVSNVLTIQPVFASAEEDVRTLLMKLRKNNIKQTNSR